jgi:hypothetical protein
MQWMAISLSFSVGAAGPVEFQPTENAKKHDGLGRARIARRGRPINPLIQRPQ